MKIPVTKPVLGDAELAAVREPLETGWLVQGPFVRRFEEQFAEFTGARHAIAVSSCTTALHVSLAALGLGPGDEVIVPAFTWVATANVVEYVGAKPVFVDVDLPTMNLDVGSLEPARTARTKAIIPVHLFGLAADMAPLLAWAAQHGIRVVEDAACGFGARHHGRHVGTLGDFGAFSFHPRKAITTGEGGMIVTEDDDAAALCRSLRDHGASKSDLERHRDPHGFRLPAFDVLGFNYRMTDLQGALGVAQMGRAHAIQDARRARAARYRERLDAFPWLALPVELEGFVHGYQSFVCLMRERDGWGDVAAAATLRDAVATTLAERGIAVRQGTHAVPGLGFYRNRYGLDLRDFPNSDRAERTSLTLPLYAQMTDDEQDYVITTLIESYEHARCAV